MPKTLLLVDDDAVTRELLSLFLEAEGWHVASAEGGEEAVAVLTGVAPRVVLCDLQMPGLSGSALAAEMRRVAKDAVLIAMTATSGAGTPAGYDSLLIKPFASGAVAAVCKAVAARAPDDRVPPPGLAAEPKQTNVDLPVVATETLRKLQGTMPAVQVRALYAFALDDAEKRIDAMEAASTDDARYKSEAHALKGSCAMIGALRLRELAAEAEVEGLSTLNRMAQFRRAVAEIRSMLETLSRDSV